MNYNAILGNKRQCCVTRIYGFRCIWNCGEFIPNTICKTCRSARTVCKNTSCAAKVVHYANVRFRWTRSHLSVSHPQLDAKVHYLVPSRTRSFSMHSPFDTHLITRVNKREVDHYNCPLIGGGEIGLVKEIQLVGDVRTHVLSLSGGRSTTTSDNSW